MDKKEIRTLLLLSSQRALLGMIYPSIRAIAVGFEGLKKLKVIYYLDKQPNDSDYESISEVAAEICADMDFISDVEELCIYTEEPLVKLDNLDSWVYIRYEELEH